MPQKMADNTVNKAKPLKKRLSKKAIQEAVDPVELNNQLESPSTPGTLLGAAPASVKMKTVGVSKLHPTATTS